MNAWARGWAVGVAAACATLLVFPGRAHAGCPLLGCASQNANTPICVNGNCVACTSDGDCSANVFGAPNCELSDSGAYGSCFSCVVHAADQGCPADAPSCNLLNGECSPSASDASAPDGGSGPMDSGMMMGPPDAMGPPPMPDGGPPMPDAMAPMPDAMTLKPDAMGPMPDAAGPVDSAVGPAPDATMPAVDSSAPDDDSSEPETDATTPGSDATSPMPDGAGPTGDAGAARGDASADASASTNPYGNGGIVEGGACSCDLVGLGGGGVGAAAAGVTIALAFARRRRRTAR